MNLFGNEPQEQAMQKLIHDTNSAFSDLDNHIKKISEWLSANAKTIEGSAPFVHVEYLKSNSKRLQAAIDNYYKKFKEDFPDNSQNKQS